MLIAYNKFQLHFVVVNDFETSFKFLVAYLPGHNIWSQYFIAVIKKCVKTLQNLDTYASTTVAMKIFSNLYWTTFSK